MALPLIEMLKFHIPKLSDRDICIYVKGSLRMPFWNGFYWNAIVNIATM